MTIKKKHAQGSGFTMYRFTSTYNNKIIVEEQSSSSAVTEKHSSTLKDMLNTVAKNQNFNRRNKKDSYKVTVDSCLKNTVQLKLLT